MKKIKNYLCILLAVLLTAGLTACGKDNPTLDRQDETSTTKTTTKTEQATQEIETISLNKEYVSHYEWYEDYPEMLVRSEYVHVTIDESDAKAYPNMAKTLEDLCVLRKNSIEDERENLISIAKENYFRDADSFTTQVSTYDIQVRRADSVAVSLLSDSYADYANIRNFRTLHGSNYDTQSGRELMLADVIKDVSEIPAIVEIEIMDRMWQAEFNSETAITDYFRNTSDDGVSWTLDYNGITFYFNPGDIAPVASGIYTATVTFAEYPDLFNEKYTAVPDSYIASLPLSTFLFTDLTGDAISEDLIVTGDYDSDGSYYYTLGVYSGSSSYEADWFAYDLNPYYVKTANGDSFLYIFSEESEAEDRQMILCVFSLKNGEIKQVGEMNMGLLYRGNNVFALPTDPDKLLLCDYNEKSSDLSFVVDKNGIPKSIEQN